MSENKTTPELTFFWYPIHLCIKNHTWLQSTPILWGINKLYYKVSLTGWLEWNLKTNGSKKESKEYVMTAKPTWAIA